MVSKSRTVSIVQLVERWIVAPKVEGSNPSSYPMNIFFILSSYNSFIFNVQQIFSAWMSNYFTTFFFLINYYILNELVWQEGFLIDFIQKKMTNNWVKLFLIYSSYLFNERLLFDKLIKSYLNLIVWPLHKLFLFEVNNVASILFVTIFLFITFFLLFTFLFFLVLFFSV